MNRPNLAAFTCVVFLSLSCASQASVITIDLNQTIAVAAVTPFPPALGVFTGTNIPTNRIVIGNAGPSLTLIGIDWHDDPGQTVLNFDFDGQRAGGPTSSTFNLGLIDSRPLRMFSGLTTPELCRRMCAYRASCGISLLRYPTPEGAHLRQIVRNVDAPRVTKRGEQLNHLEAIDELFTEAMDSVDRCQKVDFTPESRSPFFHPRPETTAVSGNGTASAVFDRRTRNHQPLADVLREAAQASDLSISEIAKRAGIDQSGLNRFMNGTRRNIRIDVADHLINILGLAVVAEDNDNRLNS